MTSTEPESNMEAPAHDALRYWFEADKSRTYASVARVLELGAATVASWCRQASPATPSSLWMIYALQAICGIPPHAWLKPTESTYLSRLSQGAFNARFERPQRLSAADPRQVQMCFDDLQPNSPHPEPRFDPDELG